MSEPIRYAFKMHEEDDAIYLGAKEQADGMWVKYEDYARLKAEVEQLTKAGDELERVLTSKMSSYEVGNASFQWRAAKEGKQ